MGWVRRAGILLIVLVVALGLGGASAGAKHKHKHKKKGKPWASQVTLAKSSSTQFNGVVTSKLQACRGSRVVTLFYTDPNTGQISPLSVQRTDGNGRYAVTLSTPAYPGTYHAQVAQRKVRALKKKQTCKEAASATVPV
jgi:hypothetical protein